MSVEIIIAFVLGLVVGLLIAWYYWAQRIAEQNARLEGLQTTVEDREHSLEMLRSQQTEGKAKLNRLQQQVGQKDSVIRDLKSQLEWRRLTIEQLGEVVTEREERLAQSKGTIRDLTAQVRRRNEAIHELQGAVSKTGEITDSDKDMSKADPTVAPAAPPVKPDNLRRIEGIGPQIANLLQNAGILTFAQLAETDVQRLEQILEQAGGNYRLADPSTWPEQARLAAAGNWQSLNSLQEELKGGRRERSQTA
jgi:predicted flap endonuclease-1-like 5' DNA nuclease